VHRRIDVAEQQPFTWMWFSIFALYHSLILSRSLPMI
jgi:hypothetical protein